MFYFLTLVQGSNVIHDEEFFRSEKVTSCGQIIGAVIGINEKIARRAAKLVKVKYEQISPIVVSIEDAIKHERKGFHLQHINNLNLN